MPCPRTAAARSRASAVRSFWVSNTGRPVSSVNRSSRAKSTRNDTRFAANTMAMSHHLRDAKTIQELMGGANGLEPVTHGPKGRRTQGNLRAECSIHPLTHGYGRRSVGVAVDPEFPLSLLYLLVCTA